MPVLELDAGLDVVRDLLLAPDDLVRAAATGRRRGAPPADVAAGEVERVELRVVDLARGPVVQADHRSGPVLRTLNHPVADPAALAAAVDELLAVPFAHWHVETTSTVVALRVTKRGQAQVSRTPRAVLGDVAAGEPATRPHDRAKERLLSGDDPLFAVLGADGPKRRQVEAFVRQLAVAVADGERAGELTAADDGAQLRPLRVVDLGCGNAYLTFAAHRWLSGRPGGARTVGVELRADLVARATRLAAQAGLSGLSFTAGSIADADPSAELGGPPDVVLALHACDTATDDALARAVRWGAPVVLAAPCCHRDVGRQLAGSDAFDGSDRASRLGPQAALVRSPILRERFADVLTDAMRADVLRALGHRVDVVEFVDSRHTPRNALLRVVRARAERLAPGTGAAALAELRGLSAAWGVEPALAQQLAPELAALG